MEKEKKEKMKIARRKGKKWVFIETTERKGNVYMREFAVREGEEILNRMTKKASRKKEGREELRGRDRNTQTLNSKKTKGREGRCFRVEGMKERVEMAGRREERERKSCHR